jgi:formate hydrogenlyase subunit 6/NADH:ubiquinone oxidoreductase subunit I
MAFFPDIGRPRFDVDEYVCTSCRSCADICPAGAITVEKKGAPEYDYEKCIACYCCMELCPQTALHLHETFRTRLYRRLGYM